MAATLAALRGLRTAPHLEAADRRALRSELETHLLACHWFTVGVMAPAALEAVAALRQLEAALGWDALELDPAGEALAAIEGPVFLKANQRTGRFLVRRELGLGSGLLITGHNPADSTCEDTWGPLPLDFFGL
ncbi:MAG: DUF1824 family protein [Cyanobacteria bacterium]|nr:DUF1824 family protein [Cyanobacteriota bacterium]